MWGANPDAGICSETLCGVRMLTAGICSEMASLLCLVQQL
jgi:hypothetical protein